MEAEKAASLAKLHKGLHSPIAEQRDAALKGVSELGELETIAELVRLLPNEALVGSAARHPTAPYDKNGIVFLNFQ